MSLTPLVAVAVLSAVLSWSIVALVAASGRLDNSDSSALYAASS